jgi:hypothetical protein
MALGKHKKTEEGRLRKERGDSLAKNLAGDYPEFKSVSGNTKLATLRKKFDVDSLNGVRKALKQQNSQKKGQ